MEQWEYEEAQTELQRKTRDWVLGLELNAFITLTSDAEDGIDYNTMRRVFGTFAHRLKCHLFAAKSKKRIEMVPVIEQFGMGYPMARKLGLRQGTHLHCLINLPGNPKDHMEKVREMWIGSSSVCGDPEVYCPNSDEWFLELNNDKLKRVYTNYALKTCRFNTDAVLWDFVPIRRMT